VLVRGRGEDLEPMATPRTWWALLPSDAGVAAAEAYGWWDQAGGSTGPDPSAFLESLAAGDPTALGGTLFNDLQDGVEAHRSDVAEARERLLEAGALGAVMCGSGPGWSTRRRAGGRRGRGGCFLDVRPPARIMVVIRGGLTAMTRAFGA
jgi:4-diphosphocytidyl-2C-methyl-D-erythritol kinase